MSNGDGNEIKKQITQACYDLRQASSMLDTFVDRGGFDGPAFLAEGYGPPRHPIGDEVSPFVGVASSHDNRGNQPSLKATSVMRCRSHRKQAHKQLISFEAGILA